MATRRQTAVSLCQAHKSAAVKWLDELSLSYHCLLAPSRCLRSSTGLTCAREPLIGAPSLQFFLSLPASVSLCLSLSRNPLNSRRSCDALVSESDGYGGNKCPQLTESDADDLCPAKRRATTAACDDCNDDRLLLLLGSARRQRQRRRLSLRPYLP